MNISEVSIRRPVMATLLTLSFVVFGIIAYQKLPVSALPRVDFPTINVSAQLPGASPESMSASVAAPLERQFATIAGLTSLTSTSSVGSTLITMQFDLDRDIDKAALDVQAAISASQRRLPAELPAPPSFRKSNPADQPVLFMALSSATLPLSTVNDYAETVLQQQISQLSGVAQVNIFGTQKYAVRILVDPEAVAARGLSLADVRSAVAATNSNTPVGVLRGERQNVTIEASGQLARARDYGGVVVSQKNGVAVKLEDVARVVDSVENDQNAGWFNNERSIVLAVYRQSDANTVETVDLIKARLASYRDQLPPSITLRVVNDRSIPIRASVEDVQFTLWLSIILVVLVIFLFLKRISATVIPALVLPVSLLGTFAAMYVLGYSLDNISLLALTLCVGFVVDDAIVMLENIVRYIEAGMKPFEAALKGSREIGFTIVSITISLVAVFIPVFFMSGVVGRVFREFAAVISCAILVSGFLSLTLTPMLCARMLKAEDHTKRPNLFERIVDATLDGLQAFYRVTLRAAMKGRVVMLLVTLATIWFSVDLYRSMPKGFFPLEDTGLLRATTEGAPDTSFEAMRARQERLIEIVRRDPAVDYLTANVGGNAGLGSTSQGFMFIALKPREDRDAASTVIGRLRQATAQVPGISFSASPVQNINLNSGRQSRALYQYTLTGQDLAELYEIAPRLRDRLAQVPELRDVALDLQLRNPQIVVDIDREQAARFGVSVESIRNTLNNAFGSRQVATIYTPSADYPVIMEANRTFQSDPDALARIFVRGANNQSVPLEVLVKLNRSVGPLSVSRIAQQPAVTMSFNTAPGVSLGEATDAIRRAERDLNLPSSVTTGFSGTAQLFQDALQGQVLLLIAAVVVIYIVLGVLYESFIHPITILSGLPSAGLGALLALKYYSLDLSVIAIIGILMLVGIVKKNAIMMVDFALERRRQGASASDAIQEAALVRFRPIMMTTLCAIFGTLPIAIGHGAGSELRQPLGIAVVGGLCVSQLLTLYITPVVYYYLDKVDTFFKGGPERTEEPGPADHGDGLAVPVRPAAGQPVVPQPVAAMVAPQGAALQRSD